MANKQRGEVTLELAGEKYTLRPSFEAICELEDLLDIGIMEIVTILHSGNVRLKFIAAIAWAGMWGYDKDNAPPFKDVGEMIMQEGITNVITQSNEDGGVLVNFLLNSVSDGTSVEATGNKSGNGKVETGKKKKGRQKGSAST